MQCGQLIGCPERFAGLACVAHGVACFCFPKLSIQFRDDVKNKNTVESRGVTYHTFHTLDVLFGFVVRAYLPW